MFTGIITHLGKFKKKSGRLYTFIAPKMLIKQIDQGASIAINGVCLTVFERVIVDTFCVEVMPETFKSTMLRSLKKDDMVNLELPVTVKSLLSGHIVQGHIDGVGEVVDIRKDQNSRIVTITFPKRLARYIVEKGSIAMNGISLTVVSVKESKFITAITDYTWQHTMMQNLKSGDLVNIEVDILAKYLERLLKR